MVIMIYPSGNVAEKIQRQAESHFGNADKMTGNEAFQHRHKKARFYDKNLTISDFGRQVGLVKIVEERDKR